MAPSKARPAYLAKAHANDTKGALQLMMPGSAKHMASLEPAAPNYYSVDWGSSRKPTVKSELVGRADFVPIVTTSTVCGLPDGYLFDMSQPPPPLDGRPIEFPMLRLKTSLSASQLGVQQPVSQGGILSKLTNSLYWI